MRLAPFKLEDYLAEREFKVAYSLCSSDVETTSLCDLLALAPPDILPYWENLHLGYTQTQGHPRLLEEIQRQYKTLEASQILTFAGAEEGIYCAFQTLLQPDDHAIVVTPAYASLETIPRSLCAVTSICLQENQGWALDIEAIRQAIRPETKLLIINFPHNPTGTTLSPETFGALIALARHHGFFIFSDEVYRLMEHDPQDRLPPIADCYEKGLSLAGMSKPYGLPGLRLGWIATQDRPLLKSIERMKYYLSICNSAPSEILALIALCGQEPLLKRNQALIRENLQQLDAFFETYSDVFRWVRPMAGCIGFPKFLLEKPITVFAEQLLQAESILILPGEVYDDTDNHFRISFGRRNMPQALAGLSRFLIQLGYA